MSNVFNILRDRNFRPSVERGSTEHAGANVQPILYGAVLIFFLIIAVFGALIISYHMNGNCLSAIVGGENCPGNGLAEIEHHLTLPHIFSQAIPFGQSVLSFILSALGILGLIYALKKALVSPSRRLSFARKRTDSSFSHILPETIRWLSRFENSPNFS